MTTSYQILSHEYTDITPCTNPDTCTKRSHWDVDADDVTADDIETWTTLNDHPAVRVIEQPDED